MVRKTVNTSCLTKCTYCKCKPIVLLTNTILAELSDCQIYTKYIYIYIAYNYIYIAYNCGT